MDRQEGFYRVKNNLRQWIVARWVENCKWWEVPGKEGDQDEEFSFVEIDENRIPMPDEEITTTLRFSLPGADDIGYSGHPQKLIEALGYKILNYEGGEIGDCVFIKVAGTVNPMPAFLTPSTYEFISQHHI